MSVSRGLSDLPEVERIRRATERGVECPVCASRWSHSANDEALCDVCAAWMDLLDPDELLVGAMEVA